MNNFFIIMERTEIVEKLTVIFRNVFNNENIVLRDDMTADDVDNWDSLTHMAMISEIEKCFSIKFKLKELNKLRQVGDLIAIVESKLQQ